MPYNFAVDSFHTKKLCSRVSSKKLTFILESATFLTPFWGLETAYDVHIRLIGKRVVGFLFVIFSLGFTADAVRANGDWKSPFLKGVGHFGPEFQVEGDIPHQPFVRG